MEENKKYEIKVETFLYLDRANANPQICIRKGKNGENEYFASLSLSEARLLAEVLPKHIARAEKEVAEFEKL